MPFAQGMQDSPVRAGAVIPRAMAKRAEPRPDEQEWLWATVSHCGIDTRDDFR